MFNSCVNSDKRIAKGDRTYGGALRINENEAYQTLYPSQITDIGSMHVASQIFEGLVKFNAKDLSIISSIAEKWEMDPTGTTYNFHLKKGVLFHDNACFDKGKGREVKAEDFKYSFERLCMSTPENINFTSTFVSNILGADNFFEASKSGKPKTSLEGVKVLDDYTLQITLETPSSSFMYNLACIGSSVVAKEAVEKYGLNMKVGTGPFLIDAEKTAERVILKRNNHYHGYDSLGNQLPFLDSIIVTFLPTKKAELEELKNENLDIVIGPPSEAVQDLVEKQIKAFQDSFPIYVLSRIPEMCTNYLEFNLTKAPFNDFKVRQAFCYAIDRNKIINKVLKEEAAGPGVYGISPPIINGYDISKISGYTFDPVKAKKLLAEAGYANGNKFPNVKIELNSGGLKNANVVVEIQKQLMEILNVNVEFEVVSLGQKIDDSMHARSEVFYSGWVADYPSPENFLSIFYGNSVPESSDKPSFPNTTRYKNAEFDHFFELGKNAKSKQESYDHFYKAEQIMVNEAPVMILWYNENYLLVRSRVKNLHSNPILFWDYSQVYLQAPAKNKEKAK